MCQALTEGNDLRNASRIPFTNAPESSDENFFAKSTASFSTTFGGVSVALNSYIANRKIARSIAAKRSNRQFSACFTISSSSTLVSPPFSSAAELWFCHFARRQLSRKLRHFNRRQPRLKSFVAALEPRAIDGLLQRVARQHAKYDRQPDVHLCQLQPSRRLRTNVIVMCRRAPQHAANRNQRIIPPASRQLLRRQRQFKRTRNPDHIHVFARSPRPLQRIHCRRQQPLRNKAVEPAYHNPKPQSGSFQLPLNPLNLEFVRHS